MCSSHYGEPGPTPVLLASVLEELVSPFGTFVDLAWHGDRAVGFTTSLRVVPAGAGGAALYMKELYVTADARGSGAGRALVAALARRAVAMGATSLRWETGEAAARGFYARLGARDDGKTHYTVDAPYLAAFAAG